jgi:uncharacterized protein
LSSRVTTGIAIDADLLPLIDATEERLRKLLGHTGSDSAIRCRIRDSGITIQVSSDQGVTTTEIREAVRQIFSSTRFNHYNAHISIEPYRQGSAFIRADS